MKPEFSRKISKYANTKSHENPSAKSWVVPCGRTDITMLMVTFYQAWASKC